MNGIFIRRFILMTVFVILSISTAMPQGRVVQNGAALALDDYFTRAEAHGFSGTVLCAKGSKIFFQKAFGTVDRTNFLPNKMSTVFNMSSLDKPMIAEAILKLHEQGSQG